MTISAPRRARGTGSVYRRADGRWYGSIELPKVDGKRRRRTVSGETRIDTLRKLVELRHHLEWQPDGLHRIVM